MGTTIRWYDHWKVVLHFAFNLSATLLSRSKYNIYWNKKRKHCTCSFPFHFESNLNFLKACATLNLGLWSLDRILTQRFVDSWKPLTNEIFLLQVSGGPLYSRHGGAGVARGTHLCQHTVQPLQRPIEVQLYPTGCWGHCLPSGMEKEQSQQHDQFQSGFFEAIFYPCFSPCHFTVCQIYFKLNINDPNQHLLYELQCE